MNDQITIKRIQAIHPKLRGELAQIYTEISQVLTGNLGCRFVQVFRTFPEQHALYLQGRGKPGPKVTDADAGRSYHNYGLAIDFCLIEDKNNDGVVQTNEIIWDRTTDIDKDKLVDWMEVVKIFLKYGWHWGASFKDYPHFEKSFGYPVKKLLEKYNKKDFIPGTTYVNL
jgi:peptidoglycan L-alanyl-D-glutamate endopeptidase CwlK